MDQYNLMNDKQINHVFNNFNNINEVLSSSGIYCFVKQNGFFQQAKMEIANLLTSLYEKKANEKFHNSLSFFEKLGYIKDEKVKKHHEKIGFNKSVISFASDSAFVIIPFLIDHFKKCSEAKKIKEFVIGWIAYINKENSILIRKKTEIFYNKINENFTESEFTNIFEKYSNSNIINFPRLIDVDNSYSFLNFIVSCSDLSNPQIIERINEFGYHWLKLPEKEINFIINNINDSQEYLSDISTFTSASIFEFFNDLTESVNHAKQYSFYCLENDIWAQKRFQNRKKIEQTINKALPIALSSLSFYTNNIFDALLISSVPIFNNLLNSDINFDKAIAIQKKIKIIKGRLSDE